MKNKSVGKNAVLNMVKTVVTLIFPLITFPYISRVLQVENLGRVNFARSFVNYFILFATLGLNTYGIREGAALRNDRGKFQKFYSQVLTITLVTTVISLATLLGITFWWMRLLEYRELILILSIGVILPTLGCEWVCAAYEDYTYITVRTLLVQFLSLILIFALIHQPEDDYRYGFILVFSSQGANLFNLLYIRKYVRFSLTRQTDARIHLKPMIVLLASSLATTIFVSSDTIVLGLISGEYNTGLYTAASKLYTVVKSLISAMIIVTIPRFSYYYSNHKLEQFHALLNRICKTLALLAIPMAAGVFTLSEDIVLVLSGEAYLDAAPTLRILSLAIVFIAASWIQSQCILIPMKKEKWVLCITSATAVLNVVLNLFLVRRWHHNAAAVTTVISEAAVVLSYHLVLRRQVKLEGLSRQLLHGAVGSTVMVAWLLYVGTWNLSPTLGLPIEIISGAALYAVVLLLLKDEIARGVTKELLRRIKGMAGKR